MRHVYSNPVDNSVPSFQLFSDVLAGAENASTDELVLCMWAYAIPRPCVRPKMLFASLCVVCCVWQAPSPYTHTHLCVAVAWGSL